MTPTRPTAALRILHLEDDPADAQMIGHLIRQEKLKARITVVDTRPSFLAALERGGYDLLLADYKLPGFDGLEALALWRTRWPAKPFLFVTGSMGEDLAVECLKGGATDYVLKGKLGRLVPAIQRAVQEARANARRRRAETALRAREAELESIINRTPFMLTRCTRDLQYRFVSTAYAEMLGRPQAEVVGRPIVEIVGEEGFKTILPHIQQVLEGTAVEFEAGVHFQGVGVRHLQIVYTPENDERGGVKGWIASILDITERKQAEEALKNSLREKEVLLREVHHRVKNNLQVISSLVGLRADGSSGPVQRAMLQDVCDRVRTIALVHEKLYRSDNLACVDFAEYAHSLLDYVWSTYGGSAERIRLALDLEPVTLPIDQAVPCGLLLNEVATNALKHAFRGRANGAVTVSLRNSANGHVSLDVRDDGVGLPPEMDWTRTASLGLQLVRMLAGQLNGAVEMRRNGGTEFHIRFAQAQPTSASDGDGGRLSQST